MRKLVMLTAALAMVAWLVPGTSLANGDGTGIDDSPHDFTDNVVAGASSNIENDDSIPAAWNNKRKEICRVCHVPHDHGSVRYGNQGILWNHEITTKASWDMYASDATMIDFIDGTIEPRLPERPSCASVAMMA